MEVKKREILVSIIIALISIMIGIFISGKISDSQDAGRESYQKAIQIEEPEIFRHCMSVNSGDGLIYGELKAVDTVSDPNIEGEWLYLSKKTQRYTMHTRTVHTGKTTRIETYWTWDTISVEELHSKRVSFCGVEFSYEKINRPDSHYIDTVKTGRHMREVFDGCDTSYIGTIFTKMADNAISDGSSFYLNKTPQETLDVVKNDGRWELVLFWVMWLILTGIVIVSFFHMDNDWLD